MFNRFPKSKDPPDLTPTRHSRAEPAPVSTGTGIHGPYPQSKSPLENPVTLPTSFPRRREPTAHTHKASRPLKTQSPSPRHSRAGGNPRPIPTKQVTSLKSRPPTPSFPRRRESTARTHKASRPLKTQTPSPRHSRAGGNPRPAPTKHVTSPKTRPPTVIPAQARIQKTVLSQRAHTEWHPTPSFPRRRESTAPTHKASHVAQERGHPLRRSRADGNPRPIPTSQVTSPRKENTRPVILAEAEIQTVSAQAR